MPLDDRAIAISATFTAEAIQPGLAFWAGELGLEYEIRFAGYNQLFQELLDPAGLFARNRGGVNVALVRFEDWRQAGISGEARRLVDAVRGAAAGFASPLILVDLPSRRSRTPSVSCARASPICRRVHVITPAEIDCALPRRRGLRSARRRARPPAVHAGVLRRAGHRDRAPHPRHRAAAPYKVAALDCDDTLWAGICGEDGPQGVTLDPPRRALQEFMAERRREGMLLALCSKNNEEDVVETFRAHPEMPLRLDGFRGAPHQLGEQGREPGGARRRAGAGARFVHPGRRQPQGVHGGAGRRAPRCWRCRCLPMPREIPEFLSHVWAFDRARVTEEDRRRAELYAQRAERVRAERSAGQSGGVPRVARNWRSRSRRCSRRRWRASRSSRSAPTR